MAIPVENIYYLLCYAWNRIEDKDRIKISVDQSTTLPDLFAKVLISATKRLLKRGIDKNYINVTSETYGVKGKLLISDTLKQNIIHRQRTICSFDDFSADILPNQILFSTLNRLLKTDLLNHTLKKELFSLCRMWYGVSFIEITHHHFSQVRLHRNNSFYAFVMNICQIVFESTLPTEKKGNYQFSDFTRDEKKMALLFEAFVRNFYRIEKTRFSGARKEGIKWAFIPSDINDSAYLPEMQTDITLENENEKIIIDTKFYKETMNVNKSGDKLKPVNLYQLFSYLINQEDGSDKSLKATGMLLYPTINEDYRLNYMYKDHPIKVRTLNLNTHWTNIETCLLQIID
ncbi:MAG: restriction endonuclease [Bacteroidetes bacterium]|nr:restriction endonuclease [Bacteroidota bacterium]